MSDDASRRAGVRRRARRWLWLWRGRWEWARGVYPREGRYAVLDWWRIGPLEVWRFRD